MTEPLSQILIILSGIIVFCLLIYLNSKEIFGFYYACRLETEEHGAEILWWVHAASKMYLGEKWTKPVCSCPICMASVHSLIFWAPMYIWQIIIGNIFTPSTLVLIYVHGIYICALAGYNYLKTADRNLDL